MSTSFAYEEIGPDQLLKLDRPLSAGERDTLWRQFIRIEDAWLMGSIAASFQSIWSDMVDARLTEPPYAVAYVNAALVFKDLEAIVPDQITSIVYFRTVVTNAQDVRTRLDHAKFYVVNDFIKCFLIAGGFKSFGARNYRGYMGGSRFGDTPPVRTGDWR